MRRLWAALCLIVVGLLAGCGPTHIALEEGEVAWGQVRERGDAALVVDLGTYERGAFTPDGSVSDVPLVAGVLVSDAGEQLEPGDVVAGDVVRVTQGADGPIEVMVLRSPEAIAAAQGEAKTVVDEDSTYVNARFASRLQDEATMRFEGGASLLVDCALSKAGDSTSAATSRLFGLNACALVGNSAEATFDGGSLETSGESASALFAYGTEAAATLNKTKVTTARDLSCGLVATAGASVGANGAQVMTSGEESPAIRALADGSLTIAGGELITNNYLSPVVYAGGAVDVAGAKVTAAHSEMAIVEGPYAVSFTDCSLAGDVDVAKGPHAAAGSLGLVLCQAGSRRAGTTALTIDGCTVSGNAGDLIYITNTTADVRLVRSSIQNADPDAALVRVCANDGNLGWGDAETSAARATVTLVGQAIEGTMVVDGPSSLAVHLEDGSTWEGALETSEGDGEVSVTVDVGCRWTLTADVRLTSLENEGIIDFAGHRITLADGTVLDGRS